MAERYKVELGRAIASRRKQLGMTQGDLADATHHKDGQTVSRWERGQNIPADLEVVATALEWTLADLVAGIEAPNRKVARQFGLVSVDDNPDTPDLAQAFNGDGARLARIEAKLDRVLAALKSQPASDPDEEADAALADLGDMPQAPDESPSTSDVDQPASRPARKRRKSA